MITAYVVVALPMLVAQLATVAVAGFWLLGLRRLAERVRPTFHHNRRRWWAFGGWGDTAGVLRGPVP